jgi:16S rRNA (uracil1498-N3)-methyltransferase
VRRFFAPPENFNQAEIVLSSEESKHLRDVLRLREGGRVAVFDGVGNEFACQINRIGRSETQLEIIEKMLPPAPESVLNLTLAVALLKGEKFDLVVQKATELGVKKIIPLQTKRADVRLQNEKDTHKKIERWRRIALEAAKQSGRAFVPTVEKPLGFENFLHSADGTKILFAERGGAGLHQIERGERIDNLTAAVGSEGGWEDSEIETARGKGFLIVTLGGRILRAETAAITVAVLLQHLAGDLR